MERFITKDGKTLRLGYTTGSCAAAAAKAAAWLLLTGREIKTVALLTPKGIRLELAVQESSQGDGWAACAIRKDSGDDPDVTNGCLIYARVQKQTGTGVTIDGGVGIGRVTKPGLDQPVGAAAINSTPRAMIRENVEEVLAAVDERCGLSVTIFAPEGERLAKKTFNPRLGIVGGISILGTTGIVEPMSEQALVDTIRVELRQKKAQGMDCALIVPGNYGSEYLRTQGIDPSLAVQCSNFIGDTLDLCRELGFRGVLLVGHVGKLVKLAGGMLNTHSKYGDCRMEILAAHGAASGLPPEQVRSLLQCVACDDALGILEKAHCREAALKSLTTQIESHLAHRAGEDLEVGAILFSKVYGILGKTSKADQLLHNLQLTVHN